MTVMSGSLYRALKEAGATEDNAIKAAEEVAAYDNRFAKLEGDMGTVKWMLGVLIAMNLSLVLKAFF